MSKHMWPVAIAAAIGLGLGLVLRHTWDMLILNVSSGGRSHGRMK
jgi:hypothetical protein